MTVSGLMRGRLEMDRQALVRVGSGPAAYVWPEVLEETLRPRAGPEAKEQIALESAPQPMYHNHHTRPLQTKTTGPRSRRGRLLGPGRARKRPEQRAGHAPALSGAGWKRTTKALV